MNSYVVDMRFVFKGKFTVKAKDYIEAEENVLKHCGLVLGGNIHTTLPDEDVNWDFAVHPDKEIVYIKKQ